LVLPFVQHRPISRARKLDVGLGRLAGLFLECVQHVNRLRKLRQIGQLSACALARNLGIFPNSVQTIAEPRNGLSSNDIRFDIGSAQAGCANALDSS
jgi:hypothetical protein